MRGGKRKWGAGCEKPTNAFFVTFRPADSLPRELLDDFFFAKASKNKFSNQPSREEITEACNDGPFSDKLGEHL